MVALSGCALLGPPPLDGRVPEWRVGDTWQYRLTAQDLARGTTLHTSPVLTVLAAEGVAGAKPVYTVNVSTLEQGFQQTARFTVDDLNEMDGAVEIVRYDFPLSVGKRWTATREVMGGTSSGEATVTREARGVSVRAGSFDAFEIVARYRFLDADGNPRANLTVTTYFSPQVRNLVLEEQRDDDRGELVSRRELARYQI